MPRRRFLAPALAALLLAPIAVSGSPAGAIDQDLVVSAASGVPGDLVEVSSASCASEVIVDDEESFEAILRVLQVRLLVGTAPDQVLAGYGIGRFDPEGLTGPAVLVIPDWADPVAPASIEAVCYELEISPDGFAETETAFDPVAFDLLPGAGPSIQSATLSRDQLRTGQGFTVETTGCTLPDASIVEAAVARGADRSGANLTDVVAFGTGEENVVDPAVVEVILSDAGISYFAGFEDSVLVEAEVEEHPNIVEPGPYTAYALCFAEVDESFTALVYEPQSLEVTDRSPTDDIDLLVVDVVADAGSPTPKSARTYELAGGSCDQEVARFGIEEESFEDEFWFGDDESGFETELAAIERARRLAGQRAGLPSSWGDEVGRSSSLASRPSSSRSSGAPSGLSGSVRATGPSAARSMLDEVFTGEVPAGPDGTWTTVAPVTIDQGIAVAFAACGDPFADGFVYDPQGAVVLPVAETPVTPPPPVAPPPPANAIPGTPRYAG